MKKLAKILGGLVVGIVGLVALVFYMTGDLVDSVDDFFVEVSNGEISTAYARLAEDFKTNTSQEQLQAFLKGTNLNEFKAASWNSRSFNNDTGKLEGTITTKTGKTIPLTVTLVKENGDWKILGIRKAAAGIDGKEKLDSLIPTNDDAVRLVRETTKVFGDSVTAKSMQGFHAFISEIWKAQYTVEKLEQAYGKLYEWGSDWNSLSNLSPVFASNPALNEEGVLIVQGHYPTKPDQLQFTYKYVMEGAAWKLLGLSVRLQPTENKTDPVDS